jgi:hypothetical protein
MSKVDMSSSFAGLRGAEFIEAVRALALIGTLKGGFLACGTCSGRAQYIGMQRCDAPGGPVCEQCAENHRQWVATAAQIADASPYCRHCNKEVDRTHLYMVGVWDGLEYEL